MIDLVVALGLALLVLERLFRSWRDVAFFRLFTAASAVTLALCVLSFSLTKARYAYVTWPSAAGDAGLREAGTVTDVDGAPVSGLGDVFSKLLPAGTHVVHAGSTFSLAREDSGAWKFWDAMDSYELEEATGGLAFLPRRPIYYLTDPTIRQQSRLPLTSGTRIISAHGQVAPTIDTVVRELGSMPVNGVTGLRVMEPSPDNGVRTIYYAPSGLPQPSAKRALSMAELVQAQLGFSGVQVLRRYPNQPVRVDMILDLDNRSIPGPGALSAYLSENPRHHFFDGVTEAIVRPRLRLLPKIQGNPALTWALGVPGAFLRQALSLPDLRYLWLYREFLPKQGYLLDDEPGLPVILFRISSLLTSLAFASALWIACTKTSRLRRLVQGKRVAFLLICAAILQLADLLQIRKL